MLANYTAGQNDSAIEGLSVDGLESATVTSVPPSPVDLAEFIPQTLRLECQV